MPNLNIFVEEDYMFKFKWLKNSLKCTTNEKTFKKIIDIAEQHLQEQQNLNKINHQQINRHHKT